MLYLVLQSVAVLVLIVAMAMMIFAGTAGLLGIILAVGTWIGKLILKMKNK